MAEPMPLAELTAVVARIRGLLLTEEKAAEALRYLSAAAKSAFPGAAGAGASLLGPDGMRVSRGETDPVVAEADGLQYALNEGPCLDAWTLGRTVVSRDIAAGDRWPRWSRAVSDGMGLRSVLSVPLAVDGTSPGALKVYALRPGAFGKESAELLELLGGAAATVLTSVQASDAPHRIGEALRRSLDSRDTVARACGALMQRHGIDQDAAMRMLLGRARTSGTMLDAGRGVLAEIPTTHE